MVKAEIAHATTIGVTGVSGTTVYLNNSIATAVAGATALTFGTIANFTGNVTVE